MTAYLFAAASLLLVAPVIAMPARPLSTQSASDGIPRGEIRGESRVIQVGPRRAIKSIAAAARVARSGDVVEIDAGDLYVYADEAAQRRQAVAERAAAGRLFGLLPPGQGAAFRALWDEFEQRITPEARFARALDRLQPLIANYEAGGRTWQANGITADQVLERVRLIEDGSQELGQYARNLVSDAVRRGILLTARA